MVIEVAALVGAGVYTAVQAASGAGIPALFSSTLGATGATVLTAFQTASTIKNVADGVKTVAEIAADSLSNKIDEKAEVKEQEQKRGIKRNEDLVQLGTDVTQQVLDNHENKIEESSKKDKQEELNAELIIDGEVLDLDENQSGKRKRDSAKGEVGGNKKRKISSQGPSSTVLQANQVNQFNKRAKSDSNESSKSDSVESKSKVARLEQERSRVDNGEIGM